MLFITSTRIGDSVLSTGLLDHFIRHHPALRVTIACGAPAAGLFEAVPGLERILALEKRRLSLHWAGLWTRCVGRTWDVVVDLRNTPISYALRARRRLRLGRVDATRHRVVGLARILGLEAEPPPPRIWVTAAHRRLACRLVPEGPPVLALGPTANWAAKIWPAASFAKLAGRLTAASGILPKGRIAVFGHANERELALPVLGALPREQCLDLVGRLSLLEVYACLERCVLYVGNDSGLMHLAAAAGIPTLGLFGPSREEAYAPWGPLADTVRPPVSYDEIFPRDFDHRRTGTLMQGLSIDRVEDAARALWARAEGRAA